MQKGDLSEQVSKPTLNVRLIRKDKRQILIEKKENFFFEVFVQYFVYFEFPKGSQKFGGF